MYSSNSGVCPGSTQPGGLVIRATLAPAVPEFTRPTNSSIRFGLFPADWMMVGFSIVRAMRGAYPRCPGCGRPAGSPHHGRPVSIDDWARIVWDYHHVGHALAKADCIIVLGSHDTRVAERGAEVFLGGWAPLLVCSGHLGALTSAMWTRSEAEIFADVAVGLGVPRDRILIEARSTNTGENVDFSRQLLAERGLHPRKAIAVQKPYMERRTLATFQQRWPELEVVVTSPQVAFDAYPTGRHPQGRRHPHHGGGPPAAHRLRPEGLVGPAGRPGRGDGGLRAPRRRPATPGGCCKEE